MKSVRNFSSEGLLAYFFSLGLSILWASPAYAQSSVTSESVPAKQSTLSASAQQSIAPAVMRSAYGQKLQIPGVPNAGKINDVLFRGAQPNEAALAQLKNLGITTIVDLRSEDQQQVQRERKQAESQGIHFVYIPVSGWSPPTNDQVAQFLSLFHNNPNEKVFVHCHFGRDRTGVFVAAYRVAIEKWPVEQAVNEMYLFGFHGHLHPSMTSFVRDFPALLISAPAFAGFKDPKSPLPAVQSSSPMPAAQPNQEKTNPAHP
jgi:protein tyrosine phosphatase (PTP) superfamily phosphohydrolase (DUF442 family)